MVLVLLALLLLRLKMLGSVEVRYDLSLRLAFLGVVEELFRSLLLLLLFSLLLLSLLLLLLLLLISLLLLLLMLLLLLISLLPLLLLLLLLISLLLLLLLLLLLSLLLLEWQVRCTEEPEDEDNVEEVFKQLERVFVDVVAVAEAVVAVVVVALRAVVSWREVVLECLKILPFLSPKIGKVWKLWAASLVRPTVVAVVAVVVAAAVVVAVVVVAVCLRISSVKSHKQILVS